MKKLFITQNMKYDGSQLKPLFAYLDYKVLGNSVVSWVGACDIPFEHMVDGEDLLEKAEIRGAEMLHFIIELFDQNLFSAVSVQRLFASIVKDVLSEKTGALWIRRGDDLYFEDKKLSISIASKSINSVMIHFAMNVVNEGTPVKTCALKDWNLDAVTLSEVLMTKLVEEIEDIQVATWKVRGLV